MNTQREIITTYYAEAENLKKKNKSIAFFSFRKVTTKVQLSEQRGKNNLQEPKQQDAGLNGRERPTLTSSWDCQEHLIDGGYKECMTGSVYDNDVVMLKG